MNSFQLLRVTVGSEKFKLLLKILKSKLIELGFTSIKTRNFQILVKDFIKIINLLGLKFSLTSHNTGLYRTEVLEKFQEKLHFSLVQPVVD